MVPEQLSVFTGVLCHAWKICFESEASSERGRQKNLPTTFWQWSFCVMKLGTSAAEQPRISCWAVLWFWKVCGETNSLDPFVKPLLNDLENTFLCVHVCTHYFHRKSYLYITEEVTASEVTWAWYTLKTILYLQFFKRKLSDYNVPKHPPFSWKLECFVFYMCERTVNVLKNTLFFSD